MIDGKTFKSGNSVAVRLPREIGFAADMRVTIERIGDVVTIRPAIDPDHTRRTLDALVADMEAIGQPSDGIQPREPFVFPDRPGL